MGRLKIKNYNMSTTKKLVSPQKDFEFISTKERVPENNENILYLTEYGVSLGIYDTYCEYLNEPGFISIQEIASGSETGVYDSEEDDVIGWLPFSVE